MRFLTFAFNLVLSVVISVCAYVSFDEDFQGNGPRVVVRSIKRIKKGEAVTIAYCDLLQPKVLL